MTEKPKSLSLPLVVYESERKESGHLLWRKMSKTQIAQVLFPAAGLVKGRWPTNIWEANNSNNSRGTAYKKQQLWNILFHQPSQCCCNRAHLCASRKKGVSTVKVRALKSILLETVCEISCPAFVQEIMES